MKTPEFWHKSSLISKFFYPLSWGYKFISRLNAKNQKRKEYFSKLKVICVGNVVVGGAGKTPLAITVAKILLGEGKKVAFLSRGYKGKLTDVIVNKEYHTAEEVGDEPLLLAETADVIVAKNRKRGAEIAESLEVDYLIMDDGFQNFTLHKDFSILVFDGGYGIGNGYLLPAGPLREDLNKALKRADIAVISGEDNSNLEAKLSSQIRVLKGSVRGNNKTLATLIGEKVIAFAGIGRPEKFLDTLKYYNFDVITFLSYPDHYYYTINDIVYLICIAEKNGAKIITTTKDWVKVPPKYRDKINPFPVEFFFKNKEEFLDIIKNKFNENF